VSGLQKPNEHCQKEHCVDYENSARSEEAPARMQGYTGTRDGAVRPSELICMSQGMSVRLYYKDEIHVKRLTIVNPSQAQAREVR